MILHPKHSTSGKTRKACFLGSRQRRPTLTSIVLETQQVGGLLGLSFLDSPAGLRGRTRGADGTWKRGDTKLQPFLEAPSLASGSLLSSNLGFLLSS